MVSVQTFRQRNTTRRLLALPTHRRGNVEINPRDLMQKEAYVIGVMNAFQHTNAAEAAAMHAHIFEALKAGQLNPIGVCIDFPRFAHVPSSLKPSSVCIAPSGCV